MASAPYWMQLWEICEPEVKRLLRGLGKLKERSQKRRLARVVKLVMRKGPTYRHGHHQRATRRSQESEFLARVYASIGEAP